ncbi:hypothetical protein Hanom_Chr15g01354261 [Helianthus anomalus]
MTVYIRKSIKPSLYFEYIFILSGVIKIWTKPVFEARLKQRKRDLYSRLDIIYFVLECICLIASTSQRLIKTGPANVSS